MNAIKGVALGFSQALIFSLIGVLIGIIIAFAVMVVTARAHVAASGWAYPYECCGGKDCWEYPESYVRESEQGFLLVPTGEFISREVARPSGDDHYHLCRSPTGKPQCFFWPRRMS